MARHPGYGRADLARQLADTVLLAIINKPDGGETCRVVQGTEKGDGALQLLFRLYLYQYLIYPDSVESRQIAGKACGIGSDGF